MTVTAAVQSYVPERYSIIPGIGAELNGGIAGDGSIVSHLFLDLHLETLRSMLQATQRGRVDADAVGKNKGNLLRDTLRKPVPVPSLEAFIGVSYAVESVLDDETRALLESVRDLKQYAQQFGNILDAKDRQMHFAPNSSEMREFVRFVELRSPRFAALAKVFHDSEIDAEHRITEHASASTSSERIWGLVVGEKLPSSSHHRRHHDENAQLEVQYSIRLNHTTLPESLYNDVQKGLPTTYQRYFTSGFLSLQSEMNAFIQVSYWSFIVSFLIGSYNIVYTSSFRKNLCKLLLLPPARSHMKARAHPRVALVQILRHP
jgi:hypothetical protein